MTEPWDCPSSCGCECAKKEIERLMAAGRAFIERHWEDEWGGYRTCSEQSYQDAVGAFYADEQSTGSK